MQQHTVLFLLAACLAGLGAGGRKAVQSPSGWQTYRNQTIGYELRHPEGHEVRATGRAGERDGSRIRVALREFAAPAPVLDIFVRHGATGMEVPAGAETGWDAEVTNVERAGAPCVMTTYRFQSGGEIAIVEVRCPEVLFRLSPRPGVTDVRSTTWWRIMSTFRFVRE